MEGALYYLGCSMWPFHHIGSRQACALQVMCCCHVGTALDGFSVQLCSGRDSSGPEGHELRSDGDGPGSEGHELASKSDSVSCTSCMCL